MINKFFDKNEDYFYFIFRLFIGLLFAEHGAMKLFGWFGSTAQAAGSLMWFVGLVEFLGGLGIAFGLLTRLSAFGSGIVMLVAYFKSHAPSGLIPVMNRGELALVYFAAFLVIMAFGGRIWSLDSGLFKKEVT